MAAPGPKPRQLLLFKCSSSVKPLSSNLPPFLNQWIKFYPRMLRKRIESELAWALVRNFLERDKENEGRRRKGLTKITRWRPEQRAGLLTLFPALSQLVMLLVLCEESPHSLPTLSPVFIYRQIKSLQWPLSFHDASKKIYISFYIFMYLLTHLLSPSLSWGKT